MVAIIRDTAKLGDRTTEELKRDILALIEGRDGEPLNQKVQYFKEDLAPYVEELTQRNPYPDPEAQIPLVLGVWTPIWSTIPFHDALPGRIHQQSYQVFRESGYYANMARYAPGHDFKLLNRFSSFLVAYDFMVLQKFAVQEGEWIIQNIGIQQAFRKRDVPLTLDAAEEWFDEVLRSRLDDLLQAAEKKQELKLENLDRNTVKKFEKTYLASPKFEHLYVDQDLRLVKTQREAKQRPSYTFAVRRR